LLKTPLYAAHVQSAARIVDFAGWSMPLVYDSIVAEHRWTRAQASVFDVSHMGRLEVIGANAAAMLDRLTTRTISRMVTGRTVYCLICNELGGVLDDVMVSRLGERTFYVVCNAGNREKILSQMHELAGEDVMVRDATCQTMMVAMQGPRMNDLLHRFVPGPLADLPHRHVTVSTLFGLKFIAFRGGYTGEVGAEIVFPAAAAQTVWQVLTTLALNGERVVKPAGLGARDTLRLEAALPLYGHELTEQIDPISAGLEFAVDLDHDFIGKGAIEKIIKHGPKQVRVGMKLSGRKAARQGHRILHDGLPVGEVTSGAFCPTVEAAIAMGYVPPELAVCGRQVRIDMGKAQEQAEIVKLPFYSRTKSP